ncbi:hypothetical protein QC761_0058950 [Podospora bellae-mahoneyi]|uniref:Cyclic nucleotide-binding domain-containing protein n=1 Tax=Podospora bellae-mahoneyi TaxID=2093777 RepID=A0ABR0FNM0_9PEZI|nr:hypothetical protein QC761_0058950 [Podospora bellae-mahoneyi]
MLEKDETLGTLCTLIADVSKVPEAERVQKNGGDGKVYYIMEGDIKVTPGSADMGYVFYLQGKRYDNIEVKCEYA